MRLEENELKHRGLGSGILEAAVPRSPHAHLRTVEKVLEVQAGPPLMLGLPGEAWTTFEKYDWQVDKVQQTQCPAWWPVHATYSNIAHHYVLMQYQACRVDDR